MPEVAGARRRAATPAESRSHAAGGAAIKALRAKLTTPDPSATRAGFASTSPPRPTATTTKAAPSGSRAGLPPMARTAKQTKPDPEVGELRRELESAFGKGASGASTLPAGNGKRLGKLPPPTAAVPGASRPTTVERLAKSPLLLQQRLEDARAKLATASSVAAESRQRASRGTPATTTSNGIGSLPGTAPAGGKRPPLPPLTHKDSESRRDSTPPQHPSSSSEPAPANTSAVDPAVDIVEKLDRWHAEQSCVEAAQSRSDGEQRVKKTNASSRPSRDAAGSESRRFRDKDTAAIRANRPPRAPRPWDGVNPASKLNESERWALQRTSASVVAMSKDVSSSGGRPPIFAGNASALAIAKRDAQRERQARKDRAANSSARGREAATVATLRQTPRDSLQPLRIALAVLGDESTASKDLTALAITDPSELATFADVLATAPGGIDELLLDGLTLPHPSVTEAEAKRRKASSRRASTVVAGSVVVDSARVSALSSIPPTSPARSRAGSSPARTRSPSVAAVSSAALSELTPSASPAPSSFADSTSTIPPTPPSSDAASSRQPSPASHPSQSPTISGGASRHDATPPDDDDRRSADPSESQSRRDASDEDDSYSDDDFESLAPSSAQPSPPRTADRREKERRPPSSRASSSSTASSAHQRQPPSELLDEPGSGAHELDPLDFDLCDIDALCVPLRSLHERRLLRAIAANKTPIAHVSLDGADEATVSSAFVRAVAEVCCVNRARRRLARLEAAGAQRRLASDLDRAEARGIAFAYLKEQRAAAKALAAEARTEFCKITLAFQVARKGAMRRQVWSEVLDDIRRASTALSKTENERRERLFNRFVGGLLALTVEAEAGPRADIHRVEDDARISMWKEHCFRHRVARVQERLRDKSLRSEKARLCHEEQTSRVLVVIERWEWLTQTLQDAQAAEADFSTRANEERIRREEERRRAMAAADDAAAAAERLREAARHQAVAQNDKQGRAIASLDKDVTRLVKVMESSRVTVMSGFAALRRLHEAFLIKVARVTSLHKQLASHFAEAPAIAVAASGLSPITAVFQPTTFGSGTGGAAAVLAEWVFVEPTLVVRLDMDRLWQVRLGLVSRELQRLVHGVEVAVFDLQDATGDHLQSMETARRTALASAPKSSANLRRGSSGLEASGMGASMRRASMPLAAAAEEQQHDADESSLTSPTKGRFGGSLPPRAAARDLSALQLFKRHLKRPVDLSAAKLDLERIATPQDVEVIRRRKVTLFAGIVTVRLDDNASPYCALRYTGEWDTVDVDPETGEPTRYHTSPVRAARQRSEQVQRNFHTDEGGNGSPHSPPSDPMEMATSITGANFVDSSVVLADDSCAEPRGLEPSVSVTGSRVIRLDVPAGASKEDLEAQLRLFAVAVIAPVPAPLIGGLDVDLDLRSLKVRSYLGRTHSRLARMSVRMPSGVGVKSVAKLEFLLSPPLLTLSESAASSDATATAAAGGGGGGRSGPHQEQHSVRHDGRSGPLSLLGQLRAHDPPPVARVSLHSTRLRLATREDLEQARKAAASQQLAATARSDEGDAAASTNSVAVDPQSPQALKALMTGVRAGAFRGLKVTVLPLVCDHREDRIAVRSDTIGDATAAAAGGGAGTGALATGIFFTPASEAFVAFGSGDNVASHDPDHDPLALTAAGRHDSDEAVGDDDNDEQEGRPATVATSADGRDVYVDGMHVAVITRPRRGALELHFVVDEALDGARHVAPVLRHLEYRNAQFDPTTGTRSYRITASSAGGVNIDMVKAIDVYVVDKPTDLRLPGPMGSVLRYPRLCDAATPLDILRDASADDPAVVVAAHNNRQQQQHNYLRRGFLIAPEAVLVDPAKTFFDGGSMRIALRQPDDTAAAAVVIGTAVALSLDAQVASAPMPAGITLVPADVEEDAVDDDLHGGDGEQEDVFETIVTMDPARQYVVTNDESVATLADAEKNPSTSASVRPPSAAMATLMLPAIVAAGAGGDEDIATLTRIADSLGSVARHNPTTSAAAAKRHAAGGERRGSTNLRSYGYRSTKRTGGGGVVGQFVPDENRRKSVVHRDDLAAQRAASASSFSQAHPDTSTDDASSTVMLAFHVYCDGLKVATLIATVATPPPAVPTQADVDATNVPASVFRHCVALEFLFARRGRATLDAAEMLLRSVQATVGAAHGEVDTATVDADITVALGPAFGRRDISGHDVVPSCDERPATGTVRIELGRSHVRFAPELRKALATQQGPGARLPSSDDGSICATPVALSPTSDQTPTHGRLAGAFPPASPMADGEDAAAPTPTPTPAEAFDIVYHENSGPLCAFAGFVSDTETAAARQAGAITDRIYGGGGFISVSIVSGADDCDGLGMIDHADPATLRDAVKHSIRAVPSGEASLSSFLPNSAASPGASPSAAKSARWRVAAGTVMTTSALKDPLYAEEVCAMRPQRVFGTHAAVTTLREQRADADASKTSAESATSPPPPSSPSLSAPSPSNHRGSKLRSSPMPGVGRSPSVAGLDPHAHHRRGSVNATNAAAAAGAGARRRSSASQRAVQQAQEAARRREEEMTLLCAVPVALEPTANDLSSLLTAPVCTTDIAPLVRPNPHLLAVQSPLAARRLSDPNGDAFSANTSSPAIRSAAAPPGSPYRLDSPNAVPAREEVTLQSSGFFALPVAGGGDDEGGIGALALLNDDDTIDRDNDELTRRHSQHLRSLARRARSVELTRSQRSFKAGKKRLSQSAVAASDDGADAMGGFARASTRVAVALLKRRRRVLEQRGIDDTFVKEADAQCFTVYHGGAPVATAYVHRKVPQLSIAIDPAVVASDGMVADLIHSVGYANWSRDPAILTKVLRMDVHRPGYGVCTALRRVRITPYDDPTEITVDAPVIRYRVGATAANIPAIPQHNTSHYHGNGIVGGALGHVGKGGRPLKITLPFPLPDSPASFHNPNGGSLRPLGARLFPAHTTRIYDPDTTHWDGGFVDVFCREGFTVAVDGRPDAPYGIDHVTGTPIGGDAMGTSTGIEGAIAAASRAPAPNFAGVARYFPVAPDGDEQPAFSANTSQDWLRGPVGRCSAHAGSYTQYRFLSVPEQRALQTKNRADDGPVANATTFIAADVLRGERASDEAFAEAIRGASSTTTATLVGSPSRFSGGGDDEDDGDADGYDDSLLLWLDEEDAQRCCLHSGAPRQARWRRRPTPVQTPTTSSGGQHGTAGFPAGSKKAHASIAKAASALTAIAADLRLDPRARLISGIADEEVVARVALSLVNADGDHEVDDFAVAEVVCARRAQLWTRPGEHLKPPAAATPQPDARAKGGSKSPAPKRPAGGKSPEPPSPEPTSVADGDDGPPPDAFFVAVDVEYRLTIALRPQPVRVEDRFVTLPLLKQVVDCVACVVSPVPVAPPASAALPVNASPQPGAPPPLLMAGAPGMHRQAWPSRQFEALRLPPATLEMKHVLRICDADNPERPGFAFVTVKALPPLIRVADLTPGYNAIPACAVAGGAAATAGFPSVPSNASIITVATGATETATTTAASSPVGEGRRRRGTIHGDSALMPLVRGPAFPPPCLHLPPASVRLSERPCGSVVPAFALPAVRPLGTCWLHAAGSGASGQARSPPPPEPLHASGTATPPSTTVHPTPAAAPPSWAEFPVSAVRHYPIRAAVDGRTDYVLPPSVAYAVISAASEPVVAAPTQAVPDKAAPGKPSKAIKGSAVTAPAGGGDRVSMTVDCFIAAGSTARDRLAMNYSGTNFMTTADGLIVWAKEAVCRCTINAPHHLRFDAVRDQHRGATRQRMERLVQCLQFQVVLNDARERDSIAGQRVVAVVVTESPAAAQQQQQQVTSKPPTAPPPPPHRSGSVSPAPPPSAGAGLVTCPKDQNGDPEAGSVVVVINVADGGALSPDAS